MPGGQAGPKGSVQTLGLQGGIDACSNSLSVLGWDAGARGQAPAITFVTSQTACVRVSHLGHKESVTAPRCDSRHVLQERQPSQGPLGRDTNQGHDLISLRNRLQHL